MRKILHIFLLILPFLTSLELRGQLGFCAGNSGDPIFMETFGTGLQDGPPLAPGTTTYNYVLGGPNQPVDGNYTISSRTNYFDWFDTTDHTPGDINGKSFIVNADFTPGEFFRRTIDGLCENTSYEFSSWVLNLLPQSGCGRNGIPINVRFEIWDNTDTMLLASGDTGNIFSKSSAIWEQYGLVFQTEPSQTSVILKMLNNGEGGCGNDLAIDDIVFRTCGDTVDLTDTINNSSIAICETDGPFETVLTANPDFSVYNTHAYQWQESMDGLVWMDIAGETNQTYTTPILTTSRFYRVKVAEDPINLANDKCNTVSDVYQVEFVPIPMAPASAGDVAFCEDIMGGVSAMVPMGTTIDWYDAPTGGTLLASGTSFYETLIPGTYYAEAITENGGCKSVSRTAVSIMYFELPIANNENLVFCEGTSIVLDASVPNATYQWSTGASSFEIQVDRPGSYSVVITDTNGCSVTKEIVLTQIDIPVIAEVVSNHRDLSIITGNTGDFEFSIDGFQYQESPVFKNIPGGIYTAFARGKNDCEVVQFSFIHRVVPRFFTPNGDGFNDRFRLEGFQLDTKLTFSIYDRFSRLLVTSNDSDFSWDGTFNGRPMPAADYWYQIQIEDQTFIGHFALKR